MSRDSGSVKERGQATGKQQNQADTKCPAPTKQLADKADMSAPLAEVHRRKVQANDSGVPGSGRRSDKQNDKQNDKRALADPQLMSVIDAWPSLPEHIKAAIKALIQAQDK